MSDHLRLRRILRHERPRSREELAGWLRAALGVDPLDHALLPASRPPLDYLCQAFFELPAERHRMNLGPQRDALVWANRGGGKTFYAAVATLLDLVFKPGVDVCILGGSLEQSLRMQEHLRRLCERPAILPLVESAAKDRLILHNGSRAVAVPASHTSVRGRRPQKLRCDEADLFDPDLWQAAQLCVRSARCGSTHTRAAVEALSTAHRPHGLMTRLIADAQQPNSHRALFRWTVIDTLDTCPHVRHCPACDLHPECAGRAKPHNAAGARRPHHAPGHIPVEDALHLKARVAADVWNAEMLCAAPRRSNLVFPEFLPDLHVLGSRDDDPLHDLPQLGTWCAGVDFGVRSPTVILWAHLAPDGVLRVLHEHAAADAALDAHIALLTGGSGLPVPEWVAPDPAGRQRNEVTATSPFLLLRKAGLHVRARPSRIDEGLRLIRARLRPAATPHQPRLFIHARCKGLIEALERYRYPDDPASLEPVKDGSDHWADALRYLVLSAEPPQRAAVLNYLR